VSARKRRGKQSQPPDHKRSPSPDGKPAGNTKRAVIVVAVGSVLLTAGVYLVGVGGFAPAPEPGSNGLDSDVASHGYVDASACAGCHADVWQTYQHTGMGRSFAVPSSDQQIEDYSSKNTYYHEASDRHYVMERRGEKVYQRRYQVGPNGEQINVEEKSADYVIGSGNHARSYLHRTPEGKLVQLPITWYSQDGGHWGMSPGYDRADHEGFRRQIGFDCMFCHNAYPATQPAGNMQTEDAVFRGPLPNGIDCQRCHGPGRDHIQAIAGGDSAENVRAAIVNPARLEPARQFEVCLQCHLEATSHPLPYAVVRYDRGPFSFRPGEPLEDFLVFFDHPPGVQEDKFDINHAAYRLRKSVCFQQSSGAMGCTTCHNPHDIPRGERAARHYAAVCRSCHESAVVKLAGDGRHGTDADCASCHMRKRRTQDAVHVVMTDHRIQRYQPADLLAPLDEKHFGDAYRGEVAATYPSPLAESPENELYVAVAQVLEGSNLNGGIPQLEALLRRNQSAHAGFHFALAEALWQNEEPARAVEAYRATLDRNPKHLPALRNLGRALGRTGQFLQAEQILGRALEINPEQPSVLANLATVHLQMGEHDRAIALLQEALRVDPDLPEALNTLGLALYAQGDLSAAAAALRDAIRARPDYAGAHANLGSVLADSGDFSAARRQFEQAVRLAPDDGNARFNYGLALTRQELLEEAVETLEAALRLNPKMANAEEALGGIHATQGDYATAIGHFRKALALNPELPTAHFQLGSLLAMQGNGAEAKTHLREALRLQPGHAGAHLAIGRLLASEDDLTQAAIHLRQAAQAGDPVTRQQAAEVLEYMNSNSKGTQRR
jgi:predicted CXXCH cytochrome family protein